MLLTAFPPLVWNRGQNFSVCVAHSALQLHAQHTKDSTWNGFWRKEGKWTSVCFCKIISFSCVFFVLIGKNIVELENVFAVDWRWCSVWLYIGKALFLSFFVFLFCESALQCSLIMLSRKRFLTVMPGCWILTSVLQLTLLFFFCLVFLIYSDF